MKFRITKKEPFVADQEALYQIEIKLLDDIPFGTYGMLNKESAHEFAADIKKYKKRHAAFVEIHRSNGRNHYSIGDYCVINATRSQAASFKLHISYFDQFITPECEYSEDELSHLVNILSKTCHSSAHDICGEYEITND